MNDSDSKKMLAEIREASLLLSKGRRTDALLLYHNVRQRAGTRAYVQFELGNLCNAIGDIDQAIIHYLVSVQEEPENLHYVSVLGIAYLNSRNHEKARTMFEKALAMKSDIPEVLNGMAMYHMGRSDYEKALTYLERACEIKPTDEKVRTNLAMTLVHLNRHQEALTHARKAVKLNEDDINSHLVLCETLTQIGDIDAVTTHLEQTLRKHRSSGAAYYELARVRKFTKADEPYIRRTEKILEQGMTPRDRYYLHFALGKMHDDCANYDVAFAHYEQGNLLQMKHFDISKPQKRFKEMKKFFNASSIQTLSAHGHPSAQPVFIVGMPRSGTTLIESIIASHPRATGAGELKAISLLANDLFSENHNLGFADRSKPELTAEKIKNYAEKYLYILQQGHDDADRIIDKMPFNFLFIGLLKTVFPNATIINAIRHPLDSCLSCYFQCFADVRWANDLRLIGQNYSLYRQAMAYWHQVMPKGTIFDIHYEDLVEDTETHARRLLDACGLEWDSSVLHFFRKSNVVKTASVAQVRQPIYKSSKMRWMNYAPHLEPLLADLAPYLEDDRQLLKDNGLSLPKTLAWRKIFAR